MVQGASAVPRRSDAEGSADPHPGLVLLNSGYTVLCMDEDGTLGSRPNQGLFDFDTRILSVHRITLDRERAHLVSSAMRSNDRWTGVLRLPLQGGKASGPRLPQDAVSLLIERRVGPGMLERLTVTNHSMAPFAATLSLEVDGDFADVGELGGERRHHGHVSREWDAGRCELAIRYEAARASERFVRGLRLRVLRSDSDVDRHGRSLRFPLTLDPGDVWSATLSFDSQVDGEWRAPPPDALDSQTLRDRAAREWGERRTRVEPAEGPLARAFERAAEDLFGLRNWELEEELARGKAARGREQDRDHEGSSGVQKDGNGAPEGGDSGSNPGSNPGGDSSGNKGDAWIVNAGVPTFTGFFGRDAITSGWQAAMLGPEMLRGSLAWAAATQATDDSAWRDEEPGKMVHEMRRGPLAELGIVPQRAYYGTQTTAAMFVLALSEYWHWTGETTVLQRYRDAALRTFDWADQFGDRDGDGFLEYEKRSSAGLKNQGWKDSDEAIRYPDGSIVEDPIATVEEQAFHLIALERMAEMLVALGEDERAEAFLAKAGVLRSRWDEAFWMPEDGFYALALDAQKRQVRTISSNPGHALGTGAVPKAKARIVADRLLADDLFSGWGVRTLSSRHPSYNPFAYHLGTVWPVENATFALGFKRYGLDSHLDRLAEGLLSAAAGCQSHRLPEALSGYPASLTDVPIVYPSSNSPQAWSASAVVQLVQVMLGLYPFAPLHLLALVRPRLPTWAPTVVLRNVRVGDACVSLRFTRQADGKARHDVLERSGQLRVVEAPPPQAEEGALTLGETLKLWALEHAPGRLARAARIALRIDVTEEAG